MPDMWIYVFGGIVVAILAMAIGYTLLSNTMNYSQKQEALRQFSDLAYDVNTVCIQEVGNYMIKAFTFPFQVRVIYATDDTFNPPPKVLEEIKNQLISSGKNVCLQFKDEQYLRCYPNPPKKLPCSVIIPYMGVLPEHEDIFIAVSKLLGRGNVREYTLLINKTAGNEVSVRIV